MGWTNNQAQTIVGLAFTYLTTTVLFSTGSAVTFGLGSTTQFDTDINISSPNGIVWDGTTRLDRDDNGVDINGRAILAANGVFVNSLAPATTTVSGTYVNVPGINFVINKQATHSAIIVRFGASCFSTVGATIVRFGVTLDGGATDDDLSQILFEAANIHKHMTGVGILHDGDPPGPYTVQIRWMRYSGAGTLTMDANDVIWFEAQEG